MVAWIIVGVAGLFEISWALGLKSTEGFSYPVPAWVYACMLLSMVLLGAAMKQIPVGPVYAVWTGIGVIGTLAGGAYWFGEPLTSLKLAFASLVLIGIAGLGIVEWCEAASAP
jgi:quaternary ammonium compound-resistance protein SugE